MVLSSFSQLSIFLFPVLVFIGLIFMNKTKLKDWKTWLGIILLTSALSIALFAILTEVMYKV